MNQSGATRLYTRKQRRRIFTALLAVVVGTAGSMCIGTAAASALAGHGWHWPTLVVRPLISPPAGSGHPQWPLLLAWPRGRTSVAVGIAVIGAVAVAAIVVWVLYRRLEEQTRHRGLADAKAITARLGRRATRRAGRYTRPGLTAWQRLRLPTTAFGYRLLTPTQPRLHTPIWADWEQRIRLVARTGWGKGARILIPIIRQLPGPALISSTEPGIFEQTVVSRAVRSTKRRFAFPRRGRQRSFPVAVADFSSPAQCWAAGWPQIHWDPVPDCADYAVATRRAEALVAGTDTSRDRGSESDKFFRTSAADVLAAWLHAAALGGKDVATLLGWLRKPDDPTPRRILDDDEHADPSAALNLETHLDARSARTTSGVLRYLALALGALATSDGRAMCHIPQAGTEFDMCDFIRAAGTVYLLADPARIERVRPLLSLFASEMFLAAEQVALSTPGKRLPVPFIGVLDELRYGVTISNLPYVASAQRKLGVGFIYAVQSSTQEEAVHGSDAAALRDAAGITIVGGIDIKIAQELADRAGQIPVVTASRGGGRREQTEQQPALTIADQQNLDDGDAVVFARGLRPFLARAASIYDQPRLLHRINREVKVVTAKVAAARALAPPDRRRVFDADPVSDGCSDMDATEFDI